MNIIVPLMHTVSSAFTTNAILYLFHKALFTATTFLLYAVMSPSDFATLATIQSIIFLMVLWLDCGLRKSIPRYAPLFSNVRHRLIMPLITAQLSMLILALPFFLYLLSYTTSHIPLLLLALGIYLAEGTTNILRSLYHAYFYHRFFNHYAALCILIDSAATIFIGLWLPSSSLIAAVLLSKFLTTSLLAYITITHWHTQALTNNIPLATPSSFNESHERIQFLKHSAYMWGTTILTSISERNFLLPFIMQVAGIVTGNSFKVAHDAALFFYRGIIKTIGSTDTALLAHIETYAMHEQRVHQHETLTRQSLQILSTQIARLAFPFLGAIILIVPIGYWFYHDQIVFHAFLIMAIGYILETIVIP